MASLLASVAAQSVNTTTVDTPPAGIDTSGATLLVGLVANKEGQTVPIFDSRANAWTKRTPVGTNGQLSVCYVINPAVGPGHTFGVGAVAAPHYPGISVLAFLSAPILGVGQYYASTGGSGNLPLTTADEILVWGCGGAWSGTLTVTVGTLLHTLALQNNIAYGIGSAYEIQTIPAARSQSFGYSGTVGTAGISFRTRDPSYRTAPAYELMRTPPTDLQWGARFTSNLLRYGGPKVISGRTFVASVPTARKVVVMTQPPQSQVIFESETLLPGALFSFPKLNPGRYVVLDMALEVGQQTQALVYDWVVPV
jgi:hypothetical protein